MILSTGGEYQHLQTSFRTPFANISSEYKHFWTMLRVDPLQFKKRCDCGSDRLCIPYALRLPLTEHYPEQELVGLRRVQKAHQFLTTPMMEGKRMIDMGQNKKNLDNIKVHFAA